jgi:CDP-paratose 2-epimerase
MKWIITGGAGFIGTNTATYLTQQGEAVIVADNLSRQGVEINLRYLQGSLHIPFVRCDVRNAADVERLVQTHPDTDVVLHLAAQVAVTTSVTDPRHDLETNLIGTFNVCEAVRNYAPEARLIYASTNKVYGALSHIPVEERGSRYLYAGDRQGIDERERLDFHSPYGCSKGAAEQYVLDYSRIYGLRTASLRQSCIYGPYQYGVEDQGWLAWFALCALVGRKITIYGNGHQVRDALHAHDLARAYLAVALSLEKSQPSTYNIGGGLANSISLLESLDLLTELTGQKIDISFADWRPGDQPLYISDNSLAAEELKWRPEINLRAGLTSMVSWIRENRDEIAALLGIAEVASGVDS